MAHDPMDVHVDREAFWAAYKALQDNGVTVAQVKAEVANLVTVAVVRQRTAHGLDRMATLANDYKEARTVVVDLVATQPDTFAWIPRRAVNAAVGAAARVLGNVQ